MSLDTCMADLVISPEIRQPEVRTDETSVRTVRRVGDAGNFYDVEFDDGLTVPVPKEVYVPARKLDFVTRLEGERVILVRSGHQVKLFYGPLDKDGLYIEPHLNR